MSCRKTCRQCEYFVDDTCCANPPSGFDTRRPTVLGNDRACRVFKESVAVETREFKIFNNVFQLTEKEAIEVYRTLTTMRSSGEGVYSFDIKGVSFQSLTAFDHIANIRELLTRF